jgi:hypothetical protein
MTEFGHPSACSRRTAIARGPSVWTRAATWIRGQAHCQTLTPGTRVNRIWPLIATKGEYASWRATRATGDFDLRTFSIRAYPVDKVPELRPGMSAYLDWRARQ